MKKFLSVLFMLVLVLSLTACGSKTIVATLTETDYLTDSEYTQKVEATFNSKDKLSSLTLSMEFNDKDTAEAYYDLLLAFATYDDDAKKDFEKSVKLSGKKIIITGDTTSDLFSYDEDVTYEEFKEKLEDDGWKIK